jgi:hypothetical protein
MVDTFAIAAIVIGSDLVGFSVILAMERRSRARLWIVIRDAARYEAQLSPPDQQQTAAGQQPVGLGRHRHSVGEQQDRVDRVDEPAIMCGERTAAPERSRAAEWEACSFFRPTARR